MKRSVLVVVIGEMEERKKNFEELFGKLKGINEKFVLKCMLTKE
jgi:hypothetical protein